VVYRAGAPHRSAGPGLVDADLRIKPLGGEHSGRTARARVFPGGSACSRKAGSRRVEECRSLSEECGANPSPGPRCAAGKPLDTRAAQGLAWVLGVESSVSRDEVVAEQPDGQVVLRQRLHHLGQRGQHDRAQRRYAMAVSASAAE